MTTTGPHRRKIRSLAATDPRRDIVPTHSVAVAGVVVRDGGRVLVVLRRDNGRWEPPGGVLELGGTFEEGVRREMAEETGVDVVVEHLTGVYENMVRGVGPLVFRCRPVGGAPRETDEAQQVCRLTPDELGERTAPAYAVRVHDAFTGTVATRPRRRRRGRRLTLPSAP